MGKTGDPSKGKKARAAKKKLKRFGENANEDEINESNTETVNASPSIVDTAENDKSEENDISVDTLIEEEWKKIKIGVQEIIKSEYKKNISLDDVPAEKMSAVWQLAKNSFLNKDISDTKLGKKILDRIDAEISFYKVKEGVIEDIKEEFGEEVNLNEVPAENMSTEWRLAKNLFLKSEIAQTEQGNRVLDKIDDEIYFYEVKYFTDDFRILKQYPEALGQRCTRKFKDAKAARRYIDYLRPRLQSGIEEYTIDEMLKEDIDDATRRILKARLEKMKDKPIPRKLTEPSFR